MLFNKSSAKAKYNWNAENGEHRSGELRNGLWNCCKENSGTDSVVDVILVEVGCLVLVLPAVPQAIYDGFHLQWDRCMDSSQVLCQIHVVRLSGWSPKIFDVTLPSSQWSTRTRVHGWCCQRAYAIIYHKNVYSTKAARFSFQKQPSKKSVFRA